MEEETEEEDDLDGDEREEARAAMTDDQVAAKALAAHAQAEHLPPEMRVLLEKDPDALFAKLAEVGRALWKALEPAFIALSKFVESLGSNEAVQRFFARLEERERWARNQRKKKPRGRRAKERSREAWARFVAARRTP